MTGSAMPERLERAMATAIEQYPFYRRFQGADASFRDLPVLDKAAINANRELLELPSQESLIVTHTSGSTGTPFRCVKTREEQRALGLAIQRSRRRAGVPTNGRMLLLGNALLADRRMVTLYGNRMMQEKPHLIQGRCSGLYELAMHVERNGLPIADSLVALQNWGEYAQPGQRREIERVFGVPMLDYYGMEEVWLIAFAGMDGVLRIDDSLVYVEALDPVTLLPVPEGETGELVVTSFVMNSLPFLRYRTGDMGRIRRDEGSGGPILTLMPFRQSSIKLPGRELQSAVLRYLDGFYKWLATDLGVRQFQLVQETHYEFRLCIAGSHSSGAELGEAADKLANLLKKVLLADELRIAVEHVEEIQPHPVSGKCHPFVSHVS
ncbi:phenylacetate-coenzyme A ligase PaaK-like adenylate-forming protein [Paenibacillus endophyticus]|uniref:Phenylacetate-coenzyme A ligase PaaK-like adenylate-forming protein n=1 Tax=Paenibacillus endophyticus TaxID=1294268 RepID=A0A7W5CAJ1_9BACL|nr:phenylacetate--CoA ligase family protein [Paenibacillus endophyticus]MBB3153599.1 phenylacetate-coenzyme A ligase PaaK-like adenylate-forming protein [Paenibacillus endophyticus]